VGGFIAPFFLVTNYIGIIDDLLTKHKFLFVLHLLKVNVITVLLFIFQVYSFFVVRGYGKKRKERKLKLQDAFNMESRNGIPLLPMDSRSCQSSSGNGVYVSAPAAPPTSLYPTLESEDSDSDQDTLAQVVVHNKGNLNINYVSH